MVETSWQEKLNRISTVACYEEVKYNYVYSALVEANRDKNTVHRALHELILQFIIY